MSSKNNPELRGAVTELRKYKGKPVKPCRVIDPAAVSISSVQHSESGEIANDAVTQAPDPLQKRSSRLRGR